MVGFILTSPTASVMWLVWTVFRCSALARTSLCSMEIRRPVIMPKMCIVLPVRVAAWSAIQSKVLAGIMCAVFLGKPSIWSALAICFTTSLLKHAIFSRKLIAPSVFAWEKDSIPRPVRKIALCKCNFIIAQIDKQKSYSLIVLQLLPMLARRTNSQGMQGRLLQCQDQTVWQTWKRSVQYKTSTQRAADRRYRFMPTNWSAFLSASQRLPSLLSMHERCQRHPGLWTSNGVWHYVKHLQFTWASRMHHSVWVKRLVMDQRWD